MDNETALNKALEIVRERAKSEGITIQKEDPIMFALMGRIEREGIEKTIEYAKAAPFLMKEKRKTGYSY